MRKNFLSKTVIILATVIIFVACKDDPPPGPPPPPPNVNYFGTPNGSWWEYSNQRIDIDGTVSNLNVFDTLRQIKDTTVAGLNAKTMEHYFNNVLTGNVATSRYAMREDGNKVFVSKEFFNLFLPDILVQYLGVLPNEIKLADGSVAEWNLTDIPSPDLMDLFDFSELPDNVTVTSITGSFKIAFKRGADANKNGYKCHSYGMRVLYDGSASISYQGSNMPIPFEIVFSEVDFYLSAGVGLIQIEARPLDIKIVVPIPFPLNLLLGDEFIFPANIGSIPGFKKNLTETNVVPTN